MIISLHDGTQYTSNKVYVYTSGIVFMDTTGTPHTINNILISFITS